MKGFRFFLLPLLLCFTSISFSQYYSTGQEPFSTKWKQINTEQFQVIFPEEYTPEAQRICNVLMEAYEAVGYSLQHKPRKISVILRTRTAFANGLVAWAPKRMELFPTIPQNPEPENWIVHLAIHETRHVIQIDKINQGITKLLGYVFGEQAVGGILGLYLPLWYLEGDAVATETALTKSGRGRLASFSQPLKPIIFENHKLTYDKATFGSYKDFVPNQYEMGYHFTSFLRKEYGTFIWDTVLTHVYKKPYAIIPFNKGLKQVSGKYKTALFEDFKKDFKIEFQQPENKLFDKFDKAYYHGSEYTSYHAPVLHSNGEVSALKSALNDITKIVKLNEEGESTLHVPGFINSFNMEGNDRYLVWTEQIPDIRWHNISYSVVKILDTSNEELSTIGHKSRYYNPHISHNGRQLVCVDVNTLYSSLLIFDLATKEVVNNFTMDKTHFVDPRFVNKNKIVSIIHTDKGQSIVLINLETKETEYLTDYTYFEIQDPLVVDSALYYIGGKDGVNNIYKIDLTTGSEIKLTDVPYGLDGLQYNRDVNSLIFSEYKANGYHVSGLKLETSEPFSYDPDREGFPYAKVIAEQENRIISEKEISKKQYPVKKYSHFSNLFNIHSWGLFYYNLDDIQVNPGITLLGQNILNTSFITASYERNLSQEADIISFDWSYHGFYPVLDNAFTYTSFSGYYQTHSDSVIQYPIDQFDYSFHARLPLNITRNKYRKIIQPSVGFRQFHRNVENIWEDSVFTGNFNALDYSFYAHVTRKKSRADIHPRLGFEIQYRFKHTPFGDNDFGNIFSLENTLYLPGFTRNASFILFAGYQKKEYAKYIFQDIQNVARGFTNPFPNDEMINLSANYVMPVWYPDWSLSSLSYIKRVYFQLFHDYSHTHFSGSAVHDFHATGIDWIGDMHLLRIIIPFKIGVRTLYLHNLNDFRFSFIFRLDLSSF